MENALKLASIAKDRIFEKIFGNENNSEEDNDGSEDEHEDYVRKNKTIRALRWVILIFLFLMIFLSLHIFTEDLIYLNSKKDPHRGIALMFAIGTMIMIGLGFYSIYYVNQFYSFIFCIAFTFLLSARMDSEFWKQNFLHSVLFHLPYFVVLFCSWTFITMSFCCK